MIFTTKDFVEVDIILRRGGHVNRSELTGYMFINDHFSELQAFYEKYECSLIRHEDGFFFLLSNGNYLPPRLLSIPCMHLGQFIAMKSRDPEITRYSGRISIKELLQSMATSIPAETLARVYAPRQRDASRDERVREEILKALKQLDVLRFITIKDDFFRPTEAITRFAELARHDNNPDSIIQESLSAQRGVFFLSGNSENDMVAGVEDEESAD